MSVNSFNVNDLPRVRSDEFVSVYSNHVEVTASRWDLTMAFFSVEEDSEGNMVRVEKSRSVFTLAHADTLCSVMADVLNQRKQAKLPAEKKKRGNST